MFAKTEWFAPDLSLVVRDYGTTILFAMGPGSVHEALEGISGPVHLQLQGDALDEVARYVTVSSPRLMWRMTWTGDRPSSPAAVTTRLGAERRARAPDAVCRRGVLGRVARFLLSFDGRRRRVPWDP